MSSSNTKLTLLYFPPAGRAGISRLILAYAGVEYDNKIVEFGKLAPIKVCFVHIFFIYIFNSETTLLLE